MRKINQHNQGQDDKAEEKHPFLYHFPHQHLKKMIKTMILHCKPGMNRLLGNTLELKLRVEVVQNLNCWLKFCLYTSSAVRGKKVIDIAVEKEVHKYYWQLYDTLFLLSGVRDKLSHLHFSQFWAKGLVFLETVMPQMYFNTE